MVGDVSAQLIELQSQFAFQEDLLAALNERVVAQDRELQNMRNAITQLSEQIRQQSTVSDGAGQSVDMDRPPHY
ncbi:MAG: SlyX protein [Zhongshania aliphaticivorans]|jgi:SlyX protein|uniref:SlyX family protein n=1 Tax=Zhongshania aliphaticivorans TaxID=1470434 RepID=UPI0039C8C4C5|tara:strand:- start:7183 stop:7404 length:222 start_codon:yes stop_codon:yes gene_type:complete